MLASFRISSFQLSAYGGLSIFKCNWYRVSRRYLHRYRHPECPMARYDGFKHYFKNWEALRRNKLTASTFGGAIGLWRKRRVQLWLEKLGAIHPFPGNFATHWSNSEEEKALERYTLITGNTVSRPDPGFQVHDTKNLEDSWLGASPDGNVNSLPYELPSRGVLEIKCPSSRIHHDTFPEDKKGSRILSFRPKPEDLNLPWKRIPPYYMPQAQGLLEIMDREWMDYYVWTPEGSSLFRVYRDEKYWALLKKALSDFWWNNVHPAKEICKQSVITNPLVQLSSLKPEPRHELCPCIVYWNKRLVDDSKLLFREINGKLTYY